jgi:hypothetical protein
LNAIPSITLKDLKALSDDALVQLLADASNELNWRRKASKPLGWVDPERSLKGGEPF